MKAGMAPVILTKASSKDVGFSLTWRIERKPLTLNAPHLVMNWDRKLVRYASSAKEILRTLIPSQSCKIPMSPSMRSDHMAVAIGIFNTGHYICVIDAVPCEVKNIAQSNQVRVA